MRQWESPPRTDQEKSLAILWNSEVRCIENVIRQQNFVAVLMKCLYEFVEKLSMPPDDQTLYVFEDEVIGVQFRCKANELQQEAIAGIVQRSLSDEREALTRCATEYNIDMSVAEPSCLADVCASQSCCVSANGSTFREIEFMDGAVYRIDLHCCADVEACLFETERQSSSPCKEVHAYRSPSVNLSPQETHRYALPTFAGFSIHTAR